MALSPFIVNASVLSDFLDKVRVIILADNSAVDTNDGTNKTSQVMDILKPVVNDDNANDYIDSGSSSAEVLSVVTGALRVSTEENDFPTTDAISVYEVKPGDTVSTIASLFGVSKNTIIWANDLKSNTVHVGDTLVILPMTGIKHTVKSGDTIYSIAKKYNADADDIAKFNGISKDAKLAIGDVVLVPDGEIETVAPVRRVGPSIVIGVEKLLDHYSSSAPSGELIRPLIGGVKTQGLHGHNAIDLGAPIGTHVLASGDGQVILAKSSGYNGGYGSMIIISHANNIQTVYAHLSKVNVHVGQTVSQGDVIGNVGNTGRSTGPHLHFEVRGAKNPF